MPKISFIIISYNNEKYLSELLDGVLAQTLQPFEIIICDDHSTDGSWALIDNYASRYPNLIRAFQHKRNTGIGHNRNFGILRAKGDLITLIDGDDRLLPKKLEMEWKALESTGHRVAYSNVYTIDAKGNRTGIWRSDTDPVPPSGDVFFNIFSRHFFPKSSSLFRNELLYRSCFDEVGYYDEKLTLFEDWDFKIRLTERFPVAYSGEALVEYRLHPEGISNMPFQMHLNSMKIVYDNNRHLSDKLPKSKRQALKKTMMSFFTNQSRGAAMAEIEKGNRWQAFLYWIESFRYHPKSFALKLAARIVLPRRVYNKLRIHP